MPNDSQVSDLFPPEAPAQSPLIIPFMIQGPPPALRGLRGGFLPITGDIVHVVSDDGICVAGMVTMTYPEKPTDVLVTLMIPTVGSGPVCIGVVRHGAEQNNRSWHDPHLCTGERQPDKAKRLIG